MLPPVAPPRPVPADGQPGFARPYFAAIGGGAFIASVFGLVTAWDGALYVLTAIDRGRPYLPYARLVNLPLELPALVARRLTDDLGVLTFLFGVPYLLIPFGALAASWWLVRGRPSLFIWASIGIGFVALPAAVFPVSEVTTSVLLTWPILLAVLCGSADGHWRSVLALALLVAASAPNAVVLLLGLAAATILVRTLSPGRPADQRWVAAFAVLAAAAAARSVVSGDISAHAIELSLNTLVGRFWTAVWGAPLVTVALAYASGASLIAARIATAKGRRDQARRMELGAAAMLIGAGIAIVMWAADARSWAYALDYRTWLPALSAPLMGLAVIDALAAARAEKDVELQRHASRRRLAFIQAGVGVATLTIVAVAWNGMNDRLRAALATSASPCVTVGSLTWTQGTALRHWSITTTSILVSGREPRHVVLADCSVDLRRGVELTHGYIRRYVQPGWFNLRPLGAALQAES